MIIGVAREIKITIQGALTPAGTETLKAAGHTVLVEAGAGAGSGLADAAYEQAGPR